VANALNCGHGDKVYRTTVTVSVTEALVLRPLLEDRGHHRVNPYLCARRQNETDMFSDHDDTSPSIAAVSALLLQGWDDKQCYRGMATAVCSNTARTCPPPTIFS